jgi:hypothetical protein
VAEPGADILGQGVHLCVDDEEPSRRHDSAELDEKRAKVHLDGERVVRCAAHYDRHGHHTSEPSRLVTVQEGLQQPCVGRLVGGRGDDHDVKPSERLDVTTHVLGVGHQDGWSVGRQLDNGSDDTPDGVCNLVGDLAGHSRGSTGWPWVPDQRSDAADQRHGRDEQAPHLRCDVLADLRAALPDGPSPQRTPTLFQAGASSKRMALGGKHVAGGSRFLGLTGRVGVHSVAGEGGHVGQNQLCQR